MIRLLVTGAEGFVGRHVMSACESGRIRNCKVLGTQRGPSSDSKHAQLEITDEQASIALIQSFAPTHVLHLAGISAPTGYKMSNSDLWAINTLATIKLAENVIKYAPSCWLLFASSGLVYGDSASITTEPLTEDAQLNPSTPYAVSKAAADLALGAMTKDGLKVIRFRPFNHTGRGQQEGFVVPGFAAQIARIELELQPPKILVGNLSAERDFLDVRDVVEAYFSAIERSETLSPGLAVNLASGVARRIEDILNYFVAASRVPARIELAAAKFRPSDTPRYVGSFERARKALNWKPSRPFETTLDEVLADARAKCASSSLTS